jgi:flavin reductase (DIM6/NTAB) family NADH-FMN oxidoreductase RutF
MTVTDGIDPKWFRTVLSQYPTGVSVVTGVSADGATVGLVVGTFTSVSLDPPLVAFLPGRTSTSWPKIESGGRFCINVLSAEQEDVCRVFAGKEPDKFRDVGWRPAGSGSPILDGAVVWIDCDIETVHEAGDHFIVIGRVRDLDAVTSNLPLLFFQGGYGRFTPGAMASADGDLSAQQQLADAARPMMEQVVATLGGRCHAMALLDDQIMVMAGAGHAGVPRMVGERTALYPAVGTSFMAFAPAELTERWLDRAETPEQRAEYAARLDEVRRRGYSVGFNSPLHARFERMWRAGEIASRPEKLSDAAKAVLRELPYDLSGAPRAGDIRSLHVPVFDAGGHAPMVLNFFPDPEAPRDRVEAERWVRALREAAAAVTAAAGGRVISA